MYTSVFELVLVPVFFRQGTVMRNTSRNSLSNNFGILFVCSILLFLISQLTAQVEECPKYCSRANDNYGPACGTVVISNGSKYYKTFPNLCQLLKRRCSNRHSSGPAIEFVKDGPCSQHFASPNPSKRQPDELQRAETESDEIQRAEIDNEFQRV